ncbi:MAG: hypothetical protein KGI50_07815 [Patescibacteria group bacterium]|nr:hypothetical protein [Patescibacteria group bacterium]
MTHWRRDKLVIATLPAGVRTLLTLESRALDSNWTEAKKFEFRICLTDCLGLNHRLHHGKGQWNLFYLMAKRFNDEQCKLIQLERLVLG